MAKATQEILHYSKYVLVFARGCGENRVVVLTNNVLQGTGERMEYWVRWEGSATLSTLNPKPLNPNPKPLTLAQVATPSERHDVEGRLA